MISVFISVRRKFPKKYFLSVHYGIIEFIRTEHWGFQSFITGLDLYEL